MNAFHDLGAQLQPAGIVEIQHLDRCAANFCEASDAHAFEGKVFGPAIAPRVKELSHLPCLRVDSGQIRALMKVAAVTCESEIIYFIRSAVLLRDDVLDVVPQLTMFLAQLTIFATLVSATSYEVACCCVHLLLGGGVELLAGLEFEN